MPKLRKVRESLLIALNEKLINDEEYVLLYNINKPSSPDLPYWRYNKFHLDDMSDEECKSEFCFFRSDVYSLAEALQIPDVITCFNSLKCNSATALCILLKRFSYPCRYLDMIPRFAKPVPQLCIITQHLTNFLYDRWGHLLNNFHQNWLSPLNLQRFSECIYRKGAPLNNC